MGRNYFQQPVGCGQWAAYLMEIIAGLLSGAVLEGDWTRRTVWTQTILTERKRDAECESALTFLRTVGIYSPNDEASQPGRLQSSILGNTLTIVCSLLADLQKGQKKSKKLVREIQIHVFVTGWSSISDGENKKPLQKFGVDTANTYTATVSFSRILNKISLTYNKMFGI